MRGGCVVAMAALLAAGCGQSAGDKQQEAAKEAAQAAQQAAQGAQQAAQGTQQAAQQAAKGLDAMAKGLEAMAGAAAGGDVKPTDPVSFREFIALFPDLDGWEKAKPTGERMSSPVPFSTAEVRYTKGDGSIEMKVMDSGFHQLLLMPYAMFLTAGYEKETTDGYEKSAKVAGQPGWEKWNSESKNGELNALVGKRFLVTIEGHRIADTKVLHEAAGKMDLNKLAALK